MQDLLCGGYDDPSIGYCQFEQRGYQVAHPNWDAFMVKPLDPDVTVADARRLYGIGTDQFLLSWLDTT